MAKGDILLNINMINFYVILNYPELIIMNLEVLSLN